MFEGKTALITGSTSGIGQGIAETFAARGCNIVLNGSGDAGEDEGDSITGAIMPIEGGRTAHQSAPGKGERR